MITVVQFAVSNFGSCLGKTTDHLTKYVLVVVFNLDMVTLLEVMKLNVLNYIKTGVQIG